MARLATAVTYCGLPALIAQDKITLLQQRLICVRCARHSGRIPTVGLYRRRCRSNGIWQRRSSEHTDTPKKLFLCGIARITVLKCGASPLRMAGEQSPPPSASARLPLNFQSIPVKVVPEGRVAKQNRRDIHAFLARPRLDRRRQLLALSVPTMLNEHQPTLDGTQIVTHVENPVEQSCWSAWAE